MLEHCTFRTEVVVTEDMLDDIRTVSPHTPAVVGDALTVEYRICIEYLRDVATRLRAMKRLGAVGTDNQSTDVLIKEVFQEFL